jgi:molecular chaperone GrpE
VPPAPEEKLDGQPMAPDPTQGPAPQAPAGAEDYDPTAPPPEDDGAPAGAVAEAQPPLEEDEPELDPEQLRERAGKADAYLALAQRTQADFENYRKRTARDVRAAEARGMSRLARELLPALDNLERALAAVEASGADEEHHLTEGIRLVQNEMAAALARTGIQGYAVKGERFDPVHHEAVAQQPVEGFEPGTIVEVLQAGYKLNDAVLRPARVIVAG